MAPKFSSAAATVLEDPVWEAILRAPLMDLSVLPEHARADIEEGMRSMHFKSSDEVGAEILSRSK